MHTQRLAALLLTATSLFFPAIGRSDNGVQNVDVTGNVVPLAASVLTPNLVADPASIAKIPKSEPYQSGILKYSDAPVLIASITKNSSITSDPCIVVSGGKSSDQCVTIIHILRWGAADHSSVMFQKWYVYDPTPLRHAFYYSSPQTRFEGSVIPGRTNFRFIYIHLNYNLNDQHTESFKSNITTGKDELVHPITYSLAITKQQTQFWKDATSLMSLLGVLTVPTKASSASDPEVGYSAVSTFVSQYNPASIAVSLANTSSAKANGSSSTIATQTYIDEGPTWVGLSFAVPLTSYKDVTYNQTNGMLTESQIDQENIYAVFDLFYPRVVPEWSTVRYVPHIILGMPIKKQPLRNTTGGLAMGWRYLEPFGSVVFNVQQRKAADGTLYNHLVYKGAWGLNISVSDVVNSIKSSASSKTASSAATTKAATSTKTQ